METIVRPDQEIRSAKNAIDHARDEYDRAISPHFVESAIKKLRRAEEAKREIHRETLSKLRRKSAVPH